MLKPLDKVETTKRFQAVILKHDFHSLKNTLSYFGAWDFVAVCFFFVLFHSTDYFSHILTKQADDSVAALVESSV